MLKNKGVSPVLNQRKWIMFTPVVTPMIIFSQWQDLIDLLAEFMGAWRLYLTHIDGRDKLL